MPERDEDSKLNDSGGNPRDRLMLLFLLFAAVIVVSWAVFLTWASVKIYEKL